MKFLPQIFFFLAEIRAALLYKIVFLQKKQKPNQNNKQTVFLNVIYFLYREKNCEIILIIVILSMTISQKEFRPTFLKLKIFLEFLRAKAATAFSAS